LDYKSGNWIPEKKVEDIFEKEPLKFLNLRELMLKKSKKEDQIKHLIVIGRM
jgi:hypothetical protein